MDEFTKKFLKEWGFDYLVSRFKGMATSKTYLKLYQKI